MKTKRIFEEGDIVTSIHYNWVGVRTATGHWTHSNEFPNRWDDDDVDHLLDSDAWVYVGNRKEFK